MSFLLRGFKDTDADSVNNLALAAFAQFRGNYSGWQVFSQFVGKMALLAESGEMIVSTQRNRIVGAVVYVGPNKPKSELFSVEWAALRMLVVDPGSRCQGVGRLLVQECINKAQRDKASVIALHTSPIMKAALRLYQRMGFVKFEDIKPICGVDYELYKLEI